jgi:transcriptional regulator with XRE-family HTH domain
MSDDRQAETPPTADQVIETYLLRREEALRHVPGDSPEAARVARTLLGEFMRRYPHAAVALEDFAAVESLIENSPEVESGTEGEKRAEEEAIVRAGMETAARLLAARRASRESEDSAPIAGLRKGAEARGLTLQALASATGLTVPLLVKLDRRLIRFASVPRQAVERIAAALGRSFEAVAEYLQGPPQFASQASFRADAAPGMTDRQDFFDAVESDLTMSVEQKEEWRKIKSAG